MEVDILVKESWFYSLERRGNKHFLSVVCGGVGLYDVDVEMSPEAALKGLENKIWLSSIAKKIRENPKKYQSLIIQCSE